MAVPQVPIDRVRPQSVATPLRSTNVSADSAGRDLIQGGQQADQLSAEAGTAALEIAAADRKLDGRRDAIERARAEDALREELDNEQLRVMTQGDSFESEESVAAYRKFVGEAALKSSQAYSGSAALEESALVYDETLARLTGEYERFAVSKSLEAGVALMSDRNKGRVSSLVGITTSNPNGLPDALDDYRDFVRREMGPGMTLDQERQALRAGSSAIAAGAVDHYIVAGAYNKAAQVMNSPMVAVALGEQEVSRLNLAILTGQVEDTRAAREMATKLHMLRSLGDFPVNGDLARALLDLRAAPTAADVTPEEALDIWEISTGLKREDHPEVVAAALKFDIQYQEVQTEILDVNQVLIDVADDGRVIAKGPESQKPTVVHPGDTVMIGNRVVFRATETRDYVLKPDEILNRNGVEIARGMVPRPEVVNMEPGQEIWRVDADGNRVERLAVGPPVVQGPVFGASFSSEVDTKLIDLAERFQQGLTNRRESLEFIAAATNKVTPNRITGQVGELSGFVRNALRAQGINPDTLTKEAGEAEQAAFFARLDAGGAEPPADVDPAAAAQAIPTGDIQASGTPLPPSDADAEMREILAPLGVASSTFAEAATGAEDLEEGDDPTDIITRVLTTGVRVYDIANLATGIASSIKARVSNTPFLGDFEYTQFSPTRDARKSLEMFTLMAMVALQRTQRFGDAEAVRILTGPLKSLIPAFMANPNALKTDLRAIDRSLRDEAKIIQDALDPSKPSSEQGSGEGKQKMRDRLIAIDQVIQMLGAPPPLEELPMYNSRDELQRAIDGGEIQPGDWLNYTGGTVPGQQGRRQYRGN